MSELGGTGPAPRPADQPAASPAAGGEAEQRRVLQRPSNDNAPSLGPLVALTVGILAALCAAFYLVV